MIKQAIAAGAITAVAPLAPANADAVITIPGAWVDYGVPVPFIDEWNSPEMLSRIGEGFYSAPGVTPVTINYHRNPIFAVDSNIQQGADLTMAEIDRQIAAGNTTITVTSLSQGTLVAEEVKRRLAADPEKYGGKDIDFVQAGNPKALADRLFPGTGTVAWVVGYTNRPYEVTEYDTTWVVGEYDMWADPPKDWNPLSWANAAAGTAFVHSQSALYTPDMPGATKTEVTNVVGGKDTTYFIPTPELPLTQPVRIVEKAVTGKTVATDELDKVLRPAIDAGYDRDKNGIADGWDKHNARVLTATQHFQERRAEHRAEAKAKVKQVRKAIHEKRQQLRKKVNRALGKKHAE